MHQGNQTISEFFLLGLVVASEQQQLIFMLFLCMYLVTMVGNLFIILAIINDVHLHSPMYFFLANLSFTDICFTTTTILKMLADIQSQSPTISFTGCLTQMYFFMLLVDLDNFLLAAMAYDRYIAICCPLHYAALLSPKRCAMLVLTPWIISNLVSVLHLSLLGLLNFCDQREIPHFFCDLEPILRLACSDTHINDLTILSKEQGHEKSTEETTQQKNLFLEMVSLAIRDTCIKVLDLDEHIEDPKPQATVPPWWLLSHAFSDPNPGPRVYIRLISS
ncbi:Olfactory receptor 1N1 [Camelus dromedarius]|uniref:Olfactory receptor n=1 Tax=Camelus dromedarius TaxID=9838 RepID=A0A5N4C2P7_CAMDR|nr:Olfactory receptor 1N1 [Camelus dromedarius]